MGGVVVEHHVDRFVGRHLTFDGIEKADKLLMPVALHTAPDDLAFEDVEGGKQGGGAVALVIVGHRGAAPLLHWQPGLGAVERLDLAFLIDAKDHGMGRWIDIQANNILELVGESGVLGDLERRTRCGWSPCPAQMRRTEDGLIPKVLAIAGALQWVASWRGAWLVSTTTRSTVSAGSGGMREGRVLSRVNPATPSCMKRSCQRHTAVLSLPMASVMALVPLPSAVSRTIRARQTCFCGRLRSRAIASNRTRSAGLTAMVIPLRIGHTRTKPRRGEYSLGAFCQVLSTLCPPLPDAGE